MKKNTLFVKMACGITAAALVLGAIGVSTYQTNAVPGVVEAEEKATGNTSDDSDDAKTLENAVTDAISESTDGVEKEETVYVFADNKGKEKDTIVSAWLKNSNNENLITDTSNLSDIENVKGDEEYSQSGDTITWDADGNDIYYQGTSSEAAPVGVNVTYKLDGKEVSADSIAGKSGKVTIRFDYTNEAKTVVDGEETTVPFTMVTGVLLPTSNFKNVKVSNGQVMSEGNNTIALGYAFPGLADAIDLNKLKADASEATGKSSTLSLPDYLEIEADATDFSLDMTMTVALPDVLSEAVGTDNTGLDDLESTLNDLDSGVDELTAGTSALSDGAGQLKNGTSQLYDGTQALASGASTLNANSSALNSGATQLADGASQLNSSLNNDTVNSQLAQLNAGSDQLVAGISKYAAGVNEYMGTVNQSTVAITSGLTESFKEQATIIDAVAGTVQETDCIPGEGEDATTVIGKAKTLVGKLETKVSNESNDTQKALYGAYLKEASSALTTMYKIVAIQTSQTQTDEQKQKLSELEAYTKAFQSDDSSVNSVLQYTSGVKQLVSSVQTVQSAASQLSSGASTLKSGVGSYTQGVGSLSSGAAILNAGLEKLDTGAAALSTGASQLDAGVDELAGGIGDMDLSTSITNLRRVIKSGQEYDNFSGKSGDTTSKVKFIIKTEGVSAD